MDKRHEKLRIPYRKEGESLDYESDAKVEALQEINGELIRVGNVDIERLPNLLSYLKIQRFAFRLILATL